MRIASGRTDAKLSFVAVDATDLKTRETGLTSFTVYRSRNGGTATAYTTPTVTELSSANMPGVYVLTVDEDTTITSGVDEEEYVVHITQASMAPVTRAVELYRPKATEGNTHAVDAGGVGDANVEEWNATAVPAEHTAGYPIATIKDGTGTGEIDTASGRVAITEAQIDQIVDETWDELKSAHTTADSFGDYLDDEITSRASQASVDTIDDLVDDLEARLTAGRAANLDNLDATVSSRATPAQVNAEVLDVVNVDTFAQPGQDAPPATTTLVRKIGDLHKAYRNEKEQTATEWRLMADDAATVDQKATVSDDGTTATKGEIVSGP
jgi:hypothetical protein